MKFHNTKIILVGSGYWGTNIANNLIKLGVKKFFIFDQNLKNSQTLKKRYPNSIEIIEDLEPYYKKKF